MDRLESRDVASDALQRLRLVMHALAATPFEPDTPELLVSQAVAAVGAEGGLLGIVRDEVWIDVLTSRGYSASRVAKFSPLMVGSQYPLTDAVFRREPIWLPTADARSARYPIMAGKTLAQGHAALPLLVGDQPIGVLGVSFEEAHPFPPEERMFLLTLADISALVLHRWQLGGTADRRPPPAGNLRCSTERCTTRAASTRRAEALSFLARQLAAATTSAQVCTIVADLLPSVLDAESAFIGVANDDRSALLIQPNSTLDPEIARRYASRPLTESLPITDAARTNSAVYVAGDDDRLLRYPDSAADARAAGLVSCAALPVHDSQDRVLGAIGIGWARPVTFDATLRAQLALITNLCGQTLERTRLHDAEHLLTAEIQRRLLRPVPTMPDCQTHAVYRPARGAGGMAGDFYAGLRLDHHRLGVLVGDVVGHGMAVAANMAELCTLIVTLLANGTPLGDIMERADKVLRLSNSSISFATLVLAIVDTERNVLSYLHVGHPPMLLRQGDRVFLLTDGRRPLLGLPAERVDAAEIAFPAGSTLVLYTDGVVERRFEVLDVGIDRLAKALASATGTAEQVAHALLDHCDTGEPAADDQALVVVRRC